MSDSESVNSHSDTSDSTIEAVNFDKILESLQLAANDVKETQDYLSYSTILDIYLSDPSKYTYDERELLLLHLYTILSEDKQLTYEIGWDLPSLLILYVDSDYDFHGPIRKAPGVHRILKIFEILAHNGNPKELFLKCNEVLSNLKIEDTKTSSRLDIQEKFFDIKLYCLFELIDSCMKRIKTYYPSRFLSMTVVSYINLIHHSSSPTISNTSFILKRLYSFARNYQSLELPANDDKEYTEEQRATIKSDEEYLQRKLLTGFITEAVNLASKQTVHGFALDLLSYLRDINGTSSAASEFRLNVPVLDRLYELCLSYDLELDVIFKNFLVDSHTIFHSFDFAKSSDELSGEIFEKIIIDYQENLAATIVNSEAKQIKDSVLGTLILFTYHISSNRSFDRIVVTFNDALVLSLRTVIPYMIHNSFTNKGIEDMVVFWSWYAIHQLSINGKSIELEIAKIPKTLLTIYYQVLLYVIISNQNRGNIRYITLTLLTRVLSLSPEEVTFSFIQDSLVNCPYDNVKSALIGVLKELLTKNKDSQALNDIADDLASSTIATTTTTGKPPLPPRKNSSSHKKYLTLNKVNLEFLFNAIEQSIGEVFPTENDELSINIHKLSILSSFLNLLVVLKDDPIVDKKSVLQLSDKVEKNCNTLLEKYNEDASKAVEINSCGILKVAIDRIKK